MLLAAGAFAATWAFSTVRPAELAITRLSGAPYFVDATIVRNQFLVRLVNKRDEPVSFRVVAEGANLTQVGLEESVTLAPLAEEVRPMVVTVPRTGYAGPFAFAIVASKRDGDPSAARASIEKASSIVRTIAPAGAHRGRSSMLPPFARLVLESEPGLDGHLPVRDPPVLDVAPRLDDLEPVEIAERLRGARDGVRR